MQKIKSLKNIKGTFKLEDVIKDIILAKDGDVVSTKRILKRYIKYIKYLISFYQIKDTKSCEDEVIAVVLNAIQNFRI